MKRLLSIWLRNWPIQRLREQLRNETAGSHPDPAPAEGHAAPVILWQTDPRRGRLVVACCPLARRLGVRPGIAIAQATELVTSQLANAKAFGSRDPVPPLVHEHDPVADRIAIERIAAKLQNEISPLVGLETFDRRPWSGHSLTEPDTLFCDLAGVTHLFCDEAGILEAVHRCLNASGFVAKLAIAENSAAAWAHAHYNPSADSISTELEIDLQALPVNALRIPTETKCTLDRLGVETIGSLLRLPRDGLARRLGSGIVNRISEVLGQSESPLEYFHPDQQYDASHELEYPTDDLEIIADRIQRLTDQIVQSLSNHQRGALRLACDLLPAERPKIRTVVGLFAPTQDRDHLGKLLQASVESLRVPAPVTKVGLSVLQSGPMRTHQASLLADESFAFQYDSVSNRSLARLVDSLSGRLGRNAVLGVRLGNNPLPERAYRTYSLTDHRTRRALARLPKKQRSERSRPSTRSTRSPSRTFYDQPEFRTPTRDDARRRPLQLLRKPVSITAIGELKSSNGTLRDLPRFKVDGRLYRAQYFWGPERIETGWWDGPTIRRDYYRIETELGNLWWIFRDLKSGKWFLHGRFC